MSKAVLHLIKDMHRLDWRAKWSGAATRPLRATVRPRSTARSAFLLSRKYPPQRSTSPSPPKYEDNQQRVTADCKLPRQPFDAQRQSAGIRSILPCSVTKCPANGLDDLIPSHSPASHHLHQGKTLNLQNQTSFCPRSPPAKCRCLPASISFGTMQPPQAVQSSQQSQQSQPSSQQSFMSQPSSQPTGVVPSMYRQFTEPLSRSGNENMLPIYSVRMRPS